MTKNNNKKNSKLSYKSNNVKRYLNVK